MGKFLFFRELRLNFEVRSDNMNSEGLARSLVESRIYKPR